MKVFCQVGPHEIRQALALADVVGAVELTRQLNAPIDAELIGRVDEAWEYIKQVLLNTVRHGQSHVTSAAEEAWKTLSGMIGAAGAKAHLIEESLLERIRVFNAGLYQSLLQQVLGEVSVGDVSLTLTTMELTQTVRIEGSLKASLTELLTVTSDRSMEVVASYQRSAKN